MMKWSTSIDGIRLLVDGIECIDMEKEEEEHCIIGIRITTKMVITTEHKTTIVIRMEIITERMSHRKMEISISNECRARRRLRLGDSVWIVIGSDIHVL